MRKLQRLGAALFAGTLAASLVPVARAADPAEPARQEDRQMDRQADKQMDKQMDKTAEHKHRRRMRHRGAEKGAARGEHADDKSGKIETENHEVGENATQGKTDHQGGGTWGGPH